MEIWKDIENYSGSYQISSLGRVKSLERDIDCGTGKRRIKEKIKNGFLSDNGYLTVCLSKGPKKKTFLIHRLVATSFIPNPDNLLQINHIDEVKTNNNIENLEWCTVGYNINYGTANERRRIKNGRK